MLIFFWRGIVILFFCIHFQGLKAQQSQEKILKVPTIFLQEGANIISNDDNFNQQIEKKQIKISGSGISYQKDGTHLIVSTRGIKKSTTENFVSHVKEAQRKKKINDLQAVQKEIVKYEKQKDSIDLGKISVPFSSNMFFTAQIGIGKVGVFAFNPHKLIQAVILDRVLKISKALDFLHSKLYYFYNNRSCSQSFDKVFSVRPPPIFYHLS